MGVSAVSDVDGVVGEGGASLGDYSAVGEEVDAQGWSKNAVLFDIEN